MNPFARDAVLFLEPALRAAAARVDFPDLYPALIQAAFGLERVLKGILWEVNPTFTLIDGTFKNAAPILHADRIKEVGAKTRDEIADKPNADVITFRTSIVRAGLFSKAVDANRASLHKLNHIRDVLAHCDLATLDSRDTRRFFLGSFYPIVAALIAEGHICLRRPNKRQTSELELVAIDFTPDVEARVEKRVARHRAIFAALSQEDIERISKQPLPPLKSDQWYERLPCPACGQQAFVRYYVDFDVEDGHAVPSGTYADHLQCPFCGIHMDDLQELDLVGVSLDGFYEEG